MQFICVLYCSSYGYIGNVINLLLSWTQQQDSINSIIVYTQNEKEILGKILEATTSE